jgi:hypothetical protein
MANYDQYMAESGRQSELDAQRRNGTYDAAKASYEGGGANPYEARKTDILRGLEDDVNKYIGELQGIAQGNYDFAAKWIEANYKEALGTDDTKRANFFKTVANDLEKQIGRIAFDYETGSYRLTQNKNLALSRLKEDEQVLTRDLTTKRMLEREQQNTSLNQRGLMDSGSRETVQGLAQRDIGLKEQDFTNQFEALARSIGRDEQDINKTYTIGQEDLATSQRRLGEDQQNLYAYKTEEEKRTLANRLRELEIQKTKEKMGLDTIAESMAYDSLS